VVTGGRDEVLRVGDVEPDVTGGFDEVLRVGDVEPDMITGGRDEVLRVGDVEPDVTGGFDEVLRVGDIEPDVLSGAAKKRGPIAGGAPAPPPIASEPGTGRRAGAAAAPEITKKATHKGIIFNIGPVFKQPP